MAVTVALAVPVIVALALYFIRLYLKSTNGICTSLKRLEGKTALVTGGTAGIGLEIAQEFARRGARVIIACPFEQEGINAQKTIIEKTGNQEIVFKLLDLGSLDSVREFASDILKTEDRLDLLINNAGVGTSKNGKNFETKDGMNFIMQVNYYGHFLLTILLLPLLKKTGEPSEPARVVNTTSTMHYIGRVDLNSNKSGLSWLPLISYCNSKFCVIPFSRELTRRLKGAPVVVNSGDPGTVATGIYNNTGPLIRLFISGFYYYCFKTPREGAQTALHVALDGRAVEVSGEVFKDCRLTGAKSTAYKDNTARILWEESVRLVKLTDEDLKKSFE